MKTTNNTSIFKRITSFILSVAMLLTFGSVFPNWSSNAITASAAGAPKKEHITTTEPFTATSTSTTTTTTATTAATTISSKKKISIESTVSVTTETTTSETTTETTSTETTTSETTTSETTTGTTTSETTAATTKSTTNTVPFKVTPIQDWKTFPTSEEFPHMGYVSQSSGWFSLVHNWDEVEIIAKYNGFNSGSDTIFAGWYAIPPELAVKQETGLYIPSNSTLWSVIHNKKLVDTIMDYNDGTIYGNIVKIPAELALNVNPTVSELTSTETTSAMQVTETTISSTFETSTTQTTLDSDAELARQQAAQAEAEKLQAEQEAQRLAEEAELARIQAELAEAEKLQAQEAERALRQKLAEEIENMKVFSFDKDKELQKLDISVSLLTKEFQQLLSDVGRNELGCAIGTDERMLLTYNENQLFSANCIAKPAVVTLLLQKLEEYDVSIMTKIILQDSDIAPYSTYMNKENGYVAGYETTLFECCYCTVSMSDNTSYFVIKRFLREAFNIDVDTWRLQMFNHQKDNGSFGKITAYNMYHEGQYVLNYLKSDSDYSRYLKGFLEYSGHYYDSVFVKALDNDTIKFKYIGFKIGWFEKSQTEMVFLEDEFGNWYLAIFLTKDNGDDIITRIAYWIDDEYRRLLDELLKNESVA